MKNTINKLANLEQSIGITDAVALIKTALPVIIQRRATLSSLLLDDDLEGASACAHKTLGSVRLYGTDVLEDLLKQIKTLEPNQDDLPDFQRQISEEFTHVIEECYGWIKTKE